MSNAVSKETQDEAIRIAKGTQQKGQTKEQTKLIAKGIEKGIAEYKKQQKAKARTRDKHKKQQAREKAKTQEGTAPQQDSTESNKSNLVPWVLLGLSWLAFAVYASAFAS